MRKALLFIKVVLLLVTFVSASSSHIAQVGSHDLLASVVLDSNIGFVHQSNSGEDEKAILDDSQQSPPSVGVTADISWQSRQPAERLVSGFLARAPPVNTSII